MPRKSRSLKRLGKTRSRKNRHLSKGYFEKLEDRILLASLPGLVTVNLDGIGNLTVQETVAGVDNSLSIQADVSNSHFVLSDVNATFATSVPGATGAGTNTLTVPFGSVTGSGIDIATDDGADNLQIDFSLGGFDKSISYDGGAPLTSPGDSLSLIGGSFTSTVYEFVDASSGSILVDGAPPIYYQNIEPIFSSITAANVVLNYTNVDETIEVFNAGSGMTQVTSTQAETITFSNPSESLTLNGGAGNDLVQVASLAANYSTVTINGNSGMDTVQTLGNLDFASGEDFAINMDVLQTSGAIEMAGSGEITFDASHHVELNPGTTITTDSGAIEIKGNALGFSSGAFAGIELDGASLTTTSGTVHLEGQGGDIGQFNSGVRLAGSSGISSSGTGNAVGSIEIIGTGGGGTDSNHGVEINSSFIAVVDADLEMNGTGFGVTAANHGVYLLGNSMIASTGTGVDAGKLTFTGEGSVDGEFGRGVYLSSSPTVSSKHGDILFNGTGGGELNNSVGVLLGSGTLVESTGGGIHAANITLNGQASVNGVDGNIGVIIGNGSLQTIDGDITLMGIGGGSASGKNNEGVSISFGSSITSTGTGTGAGMISLSGVAGIGTDGQIGLRLQDASIDSIDGDITINGQGGGSGTGIFNLGIWVTNASTVTSTGTTTNAANISINGIAGDGTETSYGLQINSLSEITSVAGDIDLTGDGSGGTGTAGIGLDIRNNSLVSTTGTGADAGNISLFGASGQGLGNSHGVFMITGAAVTTADGDIDVTGLSNGSGSSNHGILFDTGASIGTIGTGADAGNISLLGQGGLNGITRNAGIEMRSGQVTTVDGGIQLVGQGNGTGIQNHGIHLSSGTSIVSTGGGIDAKDIVLDGTAGDGTADNDGVRIDAAMISVVDADVRISGVGAGNLDTNIGVYVTTNSQIESIGTGIEAGQLIFVGQGSMDGTSVNQGVVFSGTQTITSVDGDIQIDGTGGGLLDSNAGVTIGFNVLMESTGTGSNAANITVTGQGSLAGQGNGNSGYETGRATIRNVDGDVRMTGNAGGGSATTTSNVGSKHFETIFISIGTGVEAGTISLTGIAGSIAASDIGIRFEDSTINSIDGDVTFVGQGGGDGTGEFNPGIWLRNNANISSTGTTEDAANVFVTGISGIGTRFNHGVLISDLSEINTVAGDVTVSGDVSAVASSTNFGLYVLNDSIIRSTGVGATAGTITLNGIGGDGTGNDHGVILRNDSSVLSVDGDILIDGTAEDSAFASFGVFVRDGSLVETTGIGSHAGNVTIIGHGSNGSQFGYGVYVANDARVETIDGNIEVSGFGDGTDTGNLGVRIRNNSHLTVIGNGNVLIEGTASSRPGASGRGIVLDANATITTTGTTIVLNGTASGGSPAIFATGVDSGSGDLFLNATNGVIADVDPGVDFAGSNIFVNGDLGPGSNGLPGQLGFDGEVDFIGSTTFNADINGTIVDSEFDQIQFAGPNRTIDIANLTLSVSASVASTIGFEYVIVDVIDPSSAVTGEFVGLSEGDFVSVGTASFIITYAGGDGNDVSLIGAGSPPSIVLDPMMAIDENGFATLTGTVTNPGPLDTLTLDINWGDPLSPNNLQQVILVDVPNGSQQFTLTHQYLDDNPTSTPIDTYTIAATISDNDAGTGSDSQFLTVNNVNPELFVNAIVGVGSQNNKATVNDLVTLAGSFADPGTLDTFTLVIDWGEISDAAVNADDDRTTIDFAAGTPKVFSQTHQYTTGGLFDVTFTLTDDDGGVDSGNAIQIWVSGVRIQPDTGQLQIIGTAEKDNVEIKPESSGTVIKVKTKLDGESTDYFFDSNDITNILIHLCEGDDKAKIDKNVLLNSEIYGDGGKDDLKGGGGQDLLWGGAGDDKLKGGDNADVLHGGGGDDELKGEDGDDLLFGGAGNDKLEGKDGDDQLHGGDGEDDLKGGKGSDLLFGDNDNDKLDGEDQDDVLDGGSGDDELKGGDDNDLLLGRTGNDKLKGEDGNDMLIGGFGQDELEGGGDDDLIHGGWTSNSLAELDAMMSI